ncbi:MAG: hypothetical protein IJV58_02985 [Oscillospiraceae bacterium]|nr:hypothetical protein [Oscillospiraceae bacterium]MBQ9695373.1 hypothetical protein [Oscillospiraceae bacterium]
MPKVTEKLIYQQLRRSSGSYLTAELIAGGIVGFCTVFCGTQLGWLHPFSLVGAAALLFCLVLIGRSLIRLVRTRRHPVFERYGAAPLLAELINEGLAHPLYLTYHGKPFGTLITDTFIVSGMELFSYMELRDIQTIQAASLPNMRMYAGPDPVSFAASAALNAAADRYVEGNPDYLILRDAAGMKRMYAVHQGDLERVVRLLQQAAPHIRIVSETSL